MSQTNIVDQNEPSIEALIEEFNAFGKIAAEPRVRQYQVVARAKQKEKSEFKKFCDDTKYKPSPATMRKHLKIAEEADWLLSIADRLPAEWTTIYHVAVIGQAKALELVDRGVLHAQATANELKAAAVIQVSDDTVSNASLEDEAYVAEDPCVFKVDASELSDQERLRLYDDLEEKAAPRGLLVTGLPDRLAKKRIIERDAV
jgi:hypothetical protein